MIGGMGMGTLHDLRPDAYEYGWDNSIEPALEIESGETILLHVRDASDEQIGPSSTAAAVAALDFDKVNPVSGPVFVKGAAAGDTLAVELLEFTTPSWGWTAIIPGFGLLTEEFPDPWLRISEVAGETVRFSDRISLPFRPFPGTLGVAPAEPGLHSIVPPRRWGGNMDIKHLNAGTTLYLPVGVEGALFSLGDTHAAQGDGEVCGTAIETAMDVTLRLSVRKDIQVEAPQFDVPAGTVPEQERSSHHVCTGVGPDLMEAARDAVRATIGWLGENHGLEREEAHALASVACDLRIHEVVDAPNWVVGCFVPESIFEGGCDERRRRRTRGVRQGVPPPRAAFGAAKYLHWEKREPQWRVLILALATAAIVYTFYKQVWPKPAYPYDLFPLIIAGWAVLGIVITIAFPALTRRIGKGLSEAEGIVGDG